MSLIIFNSIVKKKEMRNKISIRILFCLDHIENKFDVPIIALFKIQPKGL